MRVLGQRSRKHGRRPTNRITAKFECLEIRQTPSATPQQIAMELAHSAEHLGSEVEAAYQQFLGRAADAQGEQQWVAAIQNGLTQEQMEAEFLGSNEYINDHGGRGAGWVSGMYHDLLGRAADSQGLEAWVHALNSGVDPAAVAMGFAASRERETEKISNDYQQLLGRAATEPEIGAWVNAFEHGMTNDDVMAGFVGSTEFFHEHGDDDASFINAAYQQLLGRSADSAGEQHFENELQEGSTPTEPEPTGP